MIFRSQALLDLAVRDVFVCLKLPDGPFAWLR